MAQYRKTKNLTHLGSEISDRSQDILHKGDLFIRFLSDADQAATQGTVRIIIVGMIWSGWFTNTHENVLHSSAHQLNKQYQTKTIAAQLDELVTAKDFEAFISALNQNQALLRKLCQI